MARADRLFAVWLFLGAAMVRLLHVAFEAGTIGFDDPVGGEAAMAELAARLGAGDGWGDPSITRPPLYPYVLSVLSGGPLWVPRMLQAFLDAASCVVAFAIARELFDRRTAIVAGVATALNGALVYYSARLSSASVAVFLGLAAVWLLLRARRADRLGWWGAAGVAVGLAALNRAEMLLFVPVAVAFAARRPAAAGVVLAAALACVAPATYVNYDASGHVTPVSTEGGVRFYTGAAPQYEGMIGPRPGRDTEELTRVPAKVGADGAAARSRYYLRRGVDIIADDPARYGRLVASKLYLFWHGHELAEDFDLYAARRDSPVLATLLYHSLVLYFPFGLLAPLGLLGIVVAWRRPGTRLLVGFVGVHLAAAALFVVTSSLRLPAVAAVGIFAAFGATWLYDVARDRTRRARFAVAVAAAAVAFAAVNVPYPFAGARRDYAVRLAAERLHARGVAYYRAGRALDAAKALQRSVALRPTTLALRDFGKALIVIGRNAEGIDALVESIELATGDIGAEHWIPPNSQLIVRLGEIDPDRVPDLADRRAFLRGHDCYRRHKWDCAIPSFEQAIRDAPEGTRLRAGAEFYLAQSVAGQGIDMAAQYRYKSAIATLQRAQAMGAGNVETHLLLGLAYLRRTRTLMARHEFLAFRLAEKPAGAFFYSAARPDNDIAGALGFTVVTGYLSLIPDDPLAIEAADVIRAHWRNKAGLQPK